ncbi:MAG: NUDIX domain-containing protein [Variibacter sp.]|nr:NUDIX domain-containing protein [Variibacter sp.]
MSDAVEVLHAVEREHHPLMRPRDAATLMLIDRSGSVPKVLMGRRHSAHVFMPGKFVFPGGRVEPYDGRMPTAGDLRPEQEARLVKHVRRSGHARARALALAAIRETCEETGLVIGRKCPQAPRVPAESWSAFAQAHVVPDLSQLHFIARAITPPGRSRRFDARFFAVDADLVAHRIEGVVGPDAELDELVWIPVAEAKTLDLPTITHVVVEELARRIASGFDPATPVPFFRMIRRKMTRAML